MAVDIATHEAQIYTFQIKKDLLQYMQPILK